MWSRYKQALEINDANCQVSERVEVCDLEVKIRTKPNSENMVLKNALKL